MTQIPVLTGPVLNGTVPTGDARARPADGVGDAAAPVPEANRPGSAWAAAWAQSVPRAGAGAPDRSGPGAGVIGADIVTVPVSPGATDPDAVAASAAGWPWTADPLSLGMTPAAPASADAGPERTDQPGTIAEGLALPAGTSGTDTGPTRPPSDAAGQLPAAALPAAVPVRGAAAPIVPAGPAAAAVSASTAMAAPDRWTARAESRLPPGDAGAVPGKATVPPVLAGPQVTTGGRPLSGDATTAPETGTVGASGQTVVPPDGSPVPRPLPGAPGIGVTGGPGNRSAADAGPLDPALRTDAAAQDAAPVGRTIRAEAAARDPGAVRGTPDPATAAVAPAGGRAVADPARSGWPPPLDGAAPADAPGGNVSRAAAQSSAAPVRSADADPTRALAGQGVAAAALPPARTGDAVPLPAPVPPPAPAAAVATVPAVALSGGLSGSGTVSEGGLFPGSAAGSIAGVAAAPGLQAPPGTRARVGAPVPSADSPPVAPAAPLRSLAAAVPAVPTRPAEVPTLPESPRSLRAREARSADVPTASTPPVAASAMLPPGIALRGDPVSAPQGRPASAIPDGMVDPGMVRSDLPLATVSPGPETPGVGAPAVRHGSPGSDTPDPRAIAAQLGDAFVSALPDGAVEISLRPEELGRVRLVLSPDAGGLTVTLAAERPETLDQMRRAIDTLAADLRDLGYAGLNFRFDRSGHPGGRPSRPAADPAATVEIAPTAAAERAAAGIAAGLPLRSAARLDIRL